MCHSQIRNSPERGNSLETGFFGFFFFFSGSCCFLSSPASVLCVLLLSLAVGSSVCCYGFGRVSCFYLQTGALTTTDKNNKHTHAHTDDFRERRTQAHAHVQTNTHTHTRAQRDFGFELLLSSFFSFLLLCPFCFCAFYLISVSACR